jgi:hypothetical protein
MLNPDEGEILLVLPEQRLHGMREDLFVSISTGGNFLFKHPLTSYYRTSTESEGRVFLLDAPAPEYLLCLTRCLRAVKNMASEWPESSDSLSSFS